MKQYKGWELIKGIEDGSIKKGDKFTFTNSMDIKHEIECDGERMKYDDGATVGYVSLVNGYAFTKVQKPINFFEAMAKANEGEKVTNSYVLDGIEKDDLPKGYWYKGSKGILVWHDIEDCDDRYDVDLVDKELQSNWYIYEE